MQNIDGSDWLFEGAIAAGGPLVVGQPVAAAHPDLQVLAWAGAGGMGVVYRVDTPDGPRAVKVLAPALKEEPEARMRFDQEQTLLRRLSHDGIVRWYRAGVTDEELPFFVMDWIDGVRLDELPRGTLLREQVAMVRQLAETLSYLHSAQVAHRDLKGSNIMVERGTNRAVLCDFGIARDLTAKTSTASAIGTPGTPRFVPPDTEHTERTDVWSLAALFFELYAGRPPMAGSYPRPSEAGYPAATDAVHARAWAHAPADRYPTPRAFAEALEASLQHGAGAAPAPMGVVGVTPPPALVTAGRSMTSPVTSAGDGPRQIDDSPSPARLQLHREFLARVSSDAPTQERDSDVSADESWQAVTEWDSLPGMPSAAEVHRVMRTQVRVVRWSLLVGLVLGLVVGGTVGLSISRNEELISAIIVGLISGVLCAGVTVTAADSLFKLLLKIRQPNWGWMSSNDAILWEDRIPADTTRLDPQAIYWPANEERRLWLTMRSGRLAVWAITGTDERPQPAFASQVPPVFTGNDYLEGLLISNTLGPRSLVRLNGPRNDWRIYDRDGQLIEEGPERLVGSFRPATLEIHAGGKKRACNPWRSAPRSSNCEFLVIQGDDHALLGIYRGEREAPSGKGSTPPARKINDIVSLDRLRLTSKESIGSFAWHPSGSYLALDIEGRVSIINWDTAELIESITPIAGHPAFRAVAWSADGSLLSLDLSGSLVWDTRSRQVSEGTSAGWAAPRDAGNGTDKHRSCDGRRWIDRRDDGRCTSNFGWSGVDVTDLAWSPTDPHAFVTLGSSAGRRQLRLWRHSSVAPHHATRS
jgi:serine/threonine protein kinase